jgi:hypothetical protein
LLHSFLHDALPILTDYVGLYYTPLNRQRFYVQHAKASAITAFLLGFDNSNCSLTVEQLD